jgi:hypothetical protein
MPAGKASDTFQSSYQGPTPAIITRHYRMAADINIVAIVKGEERYVFMFDEDSRSETLRTLGRYASDPELSFSWYDAAILSQKIRKLSVAPDCSAIDGPLAGDYPARRRNGIPLSGDESRNNDHGFPGIEFPASDDLWIGDDPAL